LYVGISCGIIQEKKQMKKGHAPRRFPLRVDVYLGRDVPEDKARQKGAWMSRFTKLCVYRNFKAVSTFNKNRDTLYDQHTTPNTQ
jgi:hypothetical protein